MATLLRGLEDHWWVRKALFKRAASPASQEAEKPAQAGKASPQKLQVHLQTYVSRLTGRRSRDSTLHAGTRIMRLHVAESVNVNPPFAQQGTHASFYQSAKGWVEVNSRLVTYGVKTGASILDGSPTSQSQPKVGSRGTLSSMHEESLRPLGNGILVIDGFGRGLLACGCVT